MEQNTKILLAILLVITLPITIPLAVIIMATVITVFMLIIGLMAMNIKATLIVFALVGAGYCVYRFLNRNG